MVNIGRVMKSNLLASPQWVAGEATAVVTTPIVLVATWRDGLFVVAGKSPDQELRTQSIRASHPTGVAVLSPSSTDARFVGALPTADGARSQPRSWI